MILRLYKLNNSFPCNLWVFLKLQGAPLIWNLINLRLDRNSLSQTFGSFLSVRMQRLLGTFQSRRVAAERKLLTFTHLSGVKSFHIQYVSFCPLGEGVCDRCKQLWTWTQSNSSLCLEVVIYDKISFTVSLGGVWFKVNFLYTFKVYTFFFISMKIGEN